MIHTERRSLHQVDNHPIPPLVGYKYTSWKQPARDGIVIDPVYAIMSKSDFHGLMEYSTTIPSGVVVGKMWRRHNGAFDQGFIARGGKPIWLLCWYDVSERGIDWCTIKTRIILLSNADIEKE
jgi:hypothetical protein